MYKMKLLLALAAATLLASCVSPYKPPKEGEPFALVKMKFSYAMIMRGTRVGSRLYIRQDEGKPGTAKLGKYRKAHQKVHGHVARQPRIPMEAIKVHPKRNTDITMMVYFYWYTTEYRTSYSNGVMRTYTVQVYHERGCRAFVTFDAVSGKTYLIDYTQANVARSCSTRAYEQVNRGGNKFKLKPVGRRTPKREKKKKS